MGRFYNGDINGKWWFAVQSSDTPERFGGQKTSIDYIICNDEEFQEKMQKLKTTLGENTKIFDEFFVKNNSYNNEKLVEFFQDKGINQPKEKLQVDIEYLLSDYADYQFGLEVAKYFEDTQEESCYISSEL